MEGPLRLLQDILVTGFRLIQQSILSLRYNWGLGVLSLALAVSLWVFVTERENPTRTETVAGTVEVEAVNVPPDLAVNSITPSSVRVQASASESVLEDLSADDFRATVNLRGVTSREVSLPVEVESEVDRTDPVEALPSRVTVALEPVTSRLVQVEAEPVGSLPLGFRTGEVSVEPSEALVSGPENLIEGVAAVEADINLTGVRTDIEQQVPLQPRDERGGEIVGLTVEPKTARVRIEVVQVEFTIAAVVRPQLRGTPAAGYNVAAIRVEPAFASVTGPTEVLQAIDVVAGISTEEVSIDDARADVTRTVALRLPEGARTEQPSVTVTVDIEPAPGQLVFGVAPQVTGLAANLTADLSQPLVRVTLAGALPELEALSPEDIVATIDLGGLEAGVHTAPLRVQAPAGTTLASVTPEQLQVTIRPQ